MARIQTGAKQISNMNTARETRPDIMIVVEDKFEMFGTRCWGMRRPGANARYDRGASPFRHGARTDC